MQFSLFATAEISKVKAPMVVFSLLLIFFKICQYYDVKTFSARGIKPCYLQKEMYVTIQYFIKELLAIMWYSLITLSH